MGHMVSNYDFWFSAAPQPGVAGQQTTMKNVLVEVEKLARVAVCFFFHSLKIRLGDVDKLFSPSGLDNYVSCNNTHVFHFIMFYEQMASIYCTAFMTAL